MEPGLESAPRRHAPRIRRRTLAGVAGGRILGEVPGCVEDFGLAAVQRDEVNGTALILGELAGRKQVPEVHVCRRDQAAVGQSHVRHDHRFHRNAPYEGPAGVQEVDGRGTPHRVGAVAGDNRRGDVAKLARPLSGPSHRAHQRSVGPDHDNVLGLVVEDVQIALAVERHGAHAAEGVPVVADDRTDGEDLVGDGVQHHVRAVEGSGGACGPVLPGVAAGPEQDERCKDQQMLRARGHEPSIHGETPITFS